MKTSKGLVAAIIFIISCTTVLFGTLYQMTVSSALKVYLENDKRILTARNSEIIRRLCLEEDTQNWNDIVDLYADVIVRIETEETGVVAKTSDRVWSKFDIIVKDDFEFNGVAYTIKSSAAVDRSYLTDTTFIVRIYAFAAAAMFAILAVFGMTIYLIMLRPYRKIYNSLQNFDSDDKPERMTNRSYAAKVYNRLCDLKESVKHEQENQRRIIASISHDIKTPLTSIMGYTERLRQQDLAEERRIRYLDTVYAKSVEIRNLVSDFDEYLGYSMDQSFFKEVFCSEEICEMLSEYYCEELELEGVKVVVVNNAPGRKVCINHQKIRRVIGNLVTNSLKHFSNNEKIIEIALSHQGKNMVISISDSGVGVDEDKMNVIFEPLYTSDEGRKVAGLGLAICKEIVEAHGGKIWAEKSHLGGLCVSFTLPEHKGRQK